MIARARCLKCGERFSGQPCECARAASVGLSLGAFRRESRSVELWCPCCGRSRRVLRSGVVFQQTPISCECGFAAMLVQPLRHEPPTNPLPRKPRPIHISQPKSTQKGVTVTISQFVPFVTAPSNACERSSDCALQTDHPGDCYPIGILYEPTRSRVRAAREGR
jgi:hypothetical protein